MSPTVVLKISETSTIVARIISKALHKHTPGDIKLEYQTCLNHDEEQARVVSLSVTGRQGGVTFRSKQLILTQKVDRQEPIRCDTLYTWKKQESKFTGGGCSVILSCLRITEQSIEYKDFIKCRLEKGANFPTVPYRRFLINLPPALLKGFVFSARTSIMYLSRLR